MPSESPKKNGELFEMECEEIQKVFCDNVTPGLQDDAAGYDFDNDWDTWDVECEVRYHCIIFSLLLIFTLMNLHIYVQEEQLSVVSDAETVEETVPAVSLFSDSVQCVSTEVIIIISVITLVIVYIRFIVVSLYVRTVFLDIRNNSILWLQMSTCYSLRLILGYL